MSSGIYKITNKQNGKVYIGSSKNIEARWYSHIWGLRKDLHRNAKLQRSWNKHGESEFLFEILAEVEESRLFEVEQEFIDSYEAWKDYNICKRAQSHGLPLKTNPLDPFPLTLKLPKGLRSRVRLIPNWQNELREVIEKWVKSRGV